MASRNRNRPGLHKEDADEERALWHEVRGNGKRIDQQVVSEKGCPHTRLASTRDMALSGPPPH